MPPSDAPRKRFLGTPHPGGSDDWDQCLIALFLPSQATLQARAFELRERELKAQATSAEKRLASSHSELQSVLRRRGTEAQRAAEEFRWALRETGFHPRVPCCPHSPSLIRGLGYPFILGRGLCSATIHVLECAAASHVGEIRNLKEELGRLKPQLTKGGLEIEALQRDLAESNARRQQAEHLALTSTSRAESLATEVSSLLLKESELTEQLQVHCDGYAPCITTVFTRIIWALIALNMASQGCSEREKAPLPLSRLLSSTSV